MVLLKKYSFTFGDQFFESIALRSNLLPIALGRENEVPINQKGRKVKKREERGRLNNAVTITHPDSYREE
jgi:hypothetical protein